MKDLHLHLSGSTDPVLLFEIINETGLKLKDKDFMKFRDSLSMKKEGVQNLSEYLDIIHIIDEAQSSPSAIGQSFFKSYVDAYINGCDYLELRWNPYKRSQNFKIDFDKLIVSARGGYEKAKSIFGIEGGQIFCLGRDVEIAGNDAIFKKAVQYFNKGCIGIDVAGPEAKCPLKPEFEGYYKMANALGMLTTIHVGEEVYDGLEDVLATVIEKYKVQRIGHGVQICKFPRLMKLAEKNNIMFEICISSNLMTQAVKTEKDYAKVFKTFEENNLKYTLCTDATYPLDTTLSKEYQIFERIKAMSNKA
jgi:adenosine deaminase